MARSRRKNPFCGWTTCASEKEDKRIWNRKYRKAVKRAVQRGDEVLPLMREVSNVWDGGKDGKQYFADLKHCKPQYFEELMRK